jgi:photosystem II stability/assembly factor-like uncharacterized protein
MKGITFQDDRHGWIVGSGLVIRTEDGGQTWERLSRPTYYDLSEVDFVNPQFGYAAGGAERGCQIFHTANSGRNWRKVYENFEDGTVFDLVALNERTAIAAINGTFLLRTQDSGKTWQSVGLETPGASSVTSAAGAVWVVGRKGSFYYSADLGRTWQRPANLLQSVSNQDWNSIDFDNTKRGIAVGNKGAVAVTYDGGITWNEIKTDIIDDLRKIRLNGETGLIIGVQNIYRFSFPY